MMAPKAKVDWNAFRKFGVYWFDDTATRLSQLDATGLPEEGHVVRAVAQVQVAKSRQYVDVALNAFERELFYPGLACLRHVYETALWLQWAMRYPSTVVSRLKHWQDQNAVESRKFLKDLVPRYPPAVEVLRSVEAYLQGRTPQKVSFATLAAEVNPSAYLYYRDLCRYVHAHMSPELWNAAIPRMPPETPYYSVTVPMHLVGPVRKFFGWDDQQMLREYHELAELWMR
jgi:hypothetical protein